MKQNRWIGALSALAIVATGVAAWAADSGSAFVVQSSSPSLKAGRSVPPGHTDGPASELLTGHDLTGVSVPPGHTNGAADGSAASEASGPPSRPRPELA